ncbi:hypothetical protein FB451DRAFT_1174545 [Mycena latifolia]|nr:hypothetical protein FB451DRAFT_1174545 [Mycena latifolia]
MAGVSKKKSAARVPVSVRTRPSAAVEFFPSRHQRGGTDMRGGLKIDRDGPVSFAIGWTGGGMTGRSRRGPNDWHNGRSRDEMALFVPPQIPPARDADSVRSIGAGGGGVYYSIRRGGGEVPAAGYVPQSRTAIPGRAEFYIWLEAPRYKPLFDADIIDKLALSRKLLLSKPVRTNNVGRERRARGKCLLRPLRLSLIAPRRNRRRRRANPTARPHPVESLPRYICIQPWGSQNPVIPPAGGPTTVLKHIAHSTQRGPGQFWIARDGIKGCESFAVIGGAAFTHTRSDITNTALQTLRGWNRAVHFAPTGVRERRRTCASPGYGYGRSHTVAADLVSNLSAAKRRDEPPADFLVAAQNSSCGVETSWRLNNTRKIAMRQARRNGGVIYGAAL